MRSLGPTNHRIVLLASLLVGLLFAPVMVAQAWTTGPTVSPRADFRPLARADDKNPQAWRGSQRRSAQSLPRHERMPDITRDRAGSRKALPITRGQSAGVRFRPDERDPLADPVPPSSAVPPDPAGAGFRPIQPRARLTYEALEAQRRELAPPAQTYPGTAVTPWPQAPIAPWIW